MSKITFEEDRSSRKVTRFLLLSQIAGIGGVLMLHLWQLFFIASAVSLLTLMTLIISLLWLYARYREVPEIREKGDLNHLLFKFRKAVLNETSQIRSAAKEREVLLGAQKEEVVLALSRLQKNHLASGLAAASIQEAEIQGVDLRLKDQLADNGILSAADLTEEMAGLARLPETQRQALVIWQRSVMEGLDGTKPSSLTPAQLDSIQEKYQALHARNDALLRKRRASKQLLEHEILSFRERLRELAPLTFPRYLSISLASNGAVAALIAVVVLVSQLASAVSAAAAMRPASPPVTSLPRSTISQTVTPLALERASIVTMPSPTEILPPTETSLPTSTPTIQPVSTSTLSPQATLPTTVAACIPQNTARETGQVVGIVDGDTIDVRIDNRDVRVRYIGIDTPEQDQALYAESSAFNQKLVGNKTVTLVKDASETDPFNRLLRYVIVGDTFVNNELVALGYARASAYPPDIACVHTFEIAQHKAQLVKLGLWMPTPEVYIPAITGAEATPICDPSYPGVCIPPAPPDLDCGEIQYRRFQVLPPDPHGFDRDGDGIGCES